MVKFSCEGGNVEVVFFSDGVVWECLWSGGPV